MADAPAQLGIADDIVMSRHADALRGVLGGRGEVRFGRHDRMLYATDASIYQVEPLGVVVPGSVAAAIDVVRYCVEQRLPILPRGGGTSLAGQCTNKAVVIDFSAGCGIVLEVNGGGQEHRLRRAEVDGTGGDGGGAGTCRVEPGISIDDLNDQLRPTGLFFAPDPATARQCNIGGAIGNNAAGTRSILYGRTAESLLGVDVVLAKLPCDGAVRLEEGACARDEAARRLGEGVIDIVMRHERLIRERFPKTLRRNAGYALDMMLEDLDQARAAGRHPLEMLNLAHLICGSEGTLAVTTGALLKLHPIPKAKGLAVLGFGTLEEAIDAVVPLLALKPSAVELLDDMVVGLARANTEYSQYVRLMPPPREGGELAAVLYVEFFADGGAGEIAAKFETLGAMLPRVTPGAGAAYYTGAAEMTQALKLRKAGEPLLHGIPGSRKPLGFVEDNAVPVEKLSEFVREFKRIVSSKGTRAAFWAHASVGVLHVRPLLDLRDPADRTRMEEIASEVADLARSLGGVMSGEHGDGRVRGPLLERFFGPELMGAFREVKALFDPLNLLNPGNIVSPGPLASIHETTRVRPAGFDVHTADVDTFFDYTAESGFDHAVEMCNGAGVCRKKLGGTMCPSYMGTLDERHSTRGRGNALRLAVTGQLGGEGKPVWNDPETLATLDLCLSCKGCKTECPSNVDIAKYKAEYLAQSYRAAGKTPLRAIAFGRVRGLNKLGSIFAPVSNWVAGSWPARAVMNRMLGIAGERKLPAFAPSLFRLERGRGDAGGAEQPTIVLFADCFTAYNEPRIGSATARVLRSLGYRVVIPDCGCCARSHISTGLLGEAAGVVAGTARRLFEVVEREKAVAVVVCEPSCLSSIKDDWLRLKLPAGSGVPAGALERLAAISALPEEFIDRYWEAHPTRPAARPGPGEPVLLHGHCHQKALWGADTSARLLRRLVGDRLKVLDTGCCGMAGSFGYGDSRYALSMKIGELQLFPALRAEPAAVVVAPGTSCRHQIADGVARRAVHPMELVAELLGV